MTDRVYLLVSSFCVVEAIELLKKEGCLELGLSKQDNSWLLSFNLPIKKSKADDSLTENCPVEECPQHEMDSCEDCNVISDCIVRYNMDRANWKCAKGKVFLSPLQHNAHCDGHCKGDKCHE